MKKPKFLDGYIYHIYNRGVEKRKVFLDDRDYYRFIHDLFEFNDTELAENIYYRRLNEPYEVEPRYEVQPRKIARKLLVEILAFCLMPNHFHLLLRQVREKGIVQFMQKLGTGYTMSFNQRYDRVGCLFQGRFKGVLVQEEAHFIHLPYYIHANPLDLKYPKWKEGEISNTKEAMEFLENYKWSSFPDYISKKNFPSVTQRDFLLNFFSGPDQYKKDTIKWLKERDLEEIKEIILE